MPMPPASAMGPGKARSRVVASREPFLKQRGALAMEQDWAFVFILFTYLPPSLVWSVPEVGIV
jgi:hypothetical protein